MTETEDGSRAATKEQILEKARADIGQGKADLDGRNLEDGVRDVAIMLQERDVNLSGMNITELPEELIDVIKDDVSRLALHKNLLRGLSGISIRLPECTKLKYLVLRNNELREFPLAILDILQLEVLDIKNNKIESLPEELSKLTRLRTLSMSRNRLKRLPTCIALMSTLKIIEATKNPIEFPPPGEWRLPDEDSVYSAKSAADTIDFKKREAETVKIKHFMHEHLKQDRSRNGTDTEHSESNADTPKPARRKVSGRPPIRPSVSGIEIITLGGSIPASPRLAKIPMLPKPYARQSNGPMSAVSLNAGLAPAISSNVNDRHRSNSESHMPLTIKEKRMGMISRKQHLQNQLDIKTANRLSHNRGVSHGSALQQDAEGTMSDSSGPPSPSDASALRPAFESRLSSLPEYKRKSHLSDPMVEFARGILFSLNQVATPVRGLLGVLQEAGNNSTKAGSLERTCWTACEFLQDLNRQIEFLERLGENEEEDERRQSHTTIFSSCENCLKTFLLLGSALQTQVRELVTRGSQQYVRALMHILYASLIEVRNACKRLGNVQFRPVPVKSSQNSFRHLSPHSDERPVTSMRSRGEGDRSASGTSPRMQRGYHNPHQASFNTISRTASDVSSNPLTPFSQDSFSSYKLSTASTARSNSSPLLSAEESDERKFSQIWTKLSTACDLALKILPTCKDALLQSRTVTAYDRSEVELEALAAAYQRCRAALDTTRALKERLQSFKFNDPQERRRPDFWQLCRAFTRAHLIFSGQLRLITKRAGSSMGLEDLKGRLKPLHFWVKNVGSAIVESPWGSLAAHSGLQLDSAHPVPASQFHSSPPPIPVNGKAHTRNKQSTHNSQHPQQHQYHPSLHIQTRSAAVMPSNQPEPTSAVTVSTVSTIGTAGGNIASMGALGSGYTTSMPATPMSAALGIAATATVPAAMEQPGPAGGYFGNATAIHAPQASQSGITTPLLASNERKTSLSVERRRM